MRFFRLATYASALTMFLIFSSCGDDIESTKLEMEDFNRATVKLYAYADLNLITSGYETAPEKTPILISAPYSDFNPGAPGVWTDTAFIDSNGSIEVSLPVSSRGATYTITPFDFEAIQTQEINSNNAQIQKIYSSTATTINLLPMSYEIVELNYTSKFYNNYSETVSINLFINGEFNQLTTGYEYLPSGIALTIQGSSLWSLTVSNFESTMIGTESYSKTSIIVKKGEDLKILGFDYKKLLSNGTSDSYTYFKNYIGSFSTQDQDIIIHLDDRKNFE